MSYANQPKQNPVKTTNHLAVLHHHHIVSANLTLHTTLTTGVDQSKVVHAAALTAALAVALLLDHPIVIITMMIATAADPQVHDMTILLGIIIFLQILLKLFMIVTQKIPLC